MTTIYSGVTNPEEARKAREAHVNKQYGAQGRHQDRHQDVITGRARAQEGDQTIGRARGGEVDRGTRDQLKRTGRWDDQAERGALLDRGQPRAERAKQLASAHRGKQQDKSVLGQGRQEAWRQSIQSKISDRGQERKGDRTTKDSQTRGRRSMIRNDRVGRTAERGMVRGPAQRSQESPEANQQSINRSNRVERMPISEERQLAQDEHSARVNEIKTQRSTQGRGTPATYRRPEPAATSKGDSRTKFVKDFVANYER